MDIIRTVHVPTSEERALIERLLSVAFPARDELRTQVATAQVAWIASSGAPALRIHVTDGVPAPPDFPLVPVEGIAMDVDGVPIHFLLHVGEGLLREIEIFREDGERLLRFPSIEEIEVTVTV